MSDFNFGNLTDREFERLAIDVISEIENVQIKLFKPGKDDGIDGYFTDKEGKTVIVQAKHYWKSGLPRLLQHCISTESASVNKIEPSRYIFICSSGLSPQNMQKIQAGEKTTKAKQKNEVKDNKKKVKKIFSPYIKKIDDIYGLDDLNLFLSSEKNRHILQKHYKLWMTSTSVLKLILNSGIHERSDSKLEDIVENLKYYVRTENHDNAIKKLSQSNCLVITGEPGVGKSTLAEQICNMYVAEGYQFIEVRNIEMAWHIFDKNSQQIFYFDDFLGPNYLEALENNQDSEVIDFMKKVKKDKTKKFILTSRTSILTQGKDKSVKFKVGKLDRKEYLLNVDSITYSEKAEILYNHIYHSNLPDELASIYFVNSQYKKVINHRNYNPRLIEFITDIEYSYSKVDDYWSFVIDSLDNPAEIWKQAIETQLKQYHRFILYIICLKGIIEEQLLQTIFDQIIKKGKNIDIESEFPFTSAIRLLSGSYINRKLDDEEVDYTVINPSLTDYIIPTLFREPNVVVDLIFFLHPTMSTRQLAGLFNSRMTNNNNLVRISKKLLNRFNENKINNEFSTFLINFISDKKLISEIDNPVIENFIKKVNSNGITSYREVETLSYIASNETRYKERVNWDSVIISACKYSLDHGDLIQLTNLVYDLPKTAIVDNDSITDEISEAVINYWENDFHQHAYDELNISVEPEDEFNEYELREEIEQEIDTIAADLIYEYGDVHYCSSNDITDFFDIDSFIDELKDTHKEDVKNLKEENSDSQNLADVDWDDDEDDDEEGDIFFARGLPQR